MLTRFIYFIINLNSTFHFATVSTFNYVYFGFLSIDKIPKFLLVSIIFFINGEIIIFSFFL